MTTWWENLYDDLLAEVLLVRASEAETRATVEFLVDKLKGTKNNKEFLDSMNG